MRRYRVARDMPRSRESWVAGWPASIRRRAFDLAVGEPFPAPAQVPAGGPALGYRIGDPFPLDLKFHLRQCCHDGEDHAAHRRAGVHVAAAEVQHAKTDPSRP